MDLCSAVMPPLRGVGAAECLPREDFGGFHFKDLTSMEKVLLDSSGIWPSLLKASWWPFPKGVCSLRCELSLALRVKDISCILGVSHEWL